MCTGAVSPAVLMSTMEAPRSALPVFHPCPKPRVGHHIPGWTEEGAGQEQVTHRRHPGLSPSCHLQRPPRALRGVQGSPSTGRGCPSPPLIPQWCWVGVLMALSPRPPSQCLWTTGMGPPCVHGFCLGPQPWEGCAAWGWVCEGGRVWGRGRLCPGDAGAPVM